MVRGGGADNSPVKTESSSEVENSLVKTENSEIEMVEREDDGRSLLLVERVVETASGYGTLGAATLLVADCVGTGVLALPFDGHRMGILFFTMFMGLNLWLNVYAGRLLNAAAGETRCRDFISLARHLQASKLMVTLITCCWYANLFLILGQYMLSMAAGLDLLFGVQLCTPFSSLAAGGVVFLLSQFNTTMLALDNGPSQASILATIAVIVLCVAKIHTTDDQGNYSKWVAPRSSVLGIASSMGSVCFATAGLKLLLPVRAEMRDVGQANAAVVFAASAYCVAYVVVVLAAGPNPPGFLLDVYKYGGAARTAGLLLFCHVAISFVINLQALTTTILTAFRQKDKMTVAPRPTVWLLVTASLIGTAWLIANAVPFFDDLVSLIGALTSAPLGFAIPALLYRQSTTSWELGPLLVVLYTALVLVAGTTGAVVSISKAWEHINRPFQCS